MSSQGSRSERRKEVTEHKEKLLADLEKVKQLASEVANLFNHTCLFLWLYFWRVLMPDISLPSFSIPFVFKRIVSAILAMGGETGDAVENEAEQGHHRQNLAEGPFKWVKKQEKQRIDEQISKIRAGNQENLEDPNGTIMLGIQRGPFGETPLLLATLYDSRSEAQQCIEHKNRSWNDITENIVETLWQGMPELRALVYHKPTKEGNRGEYDGESVLHLAIATKNRPLVNFFMKKPHDLSDQGFEALKKKLFESKAIGTFHTVGKFSVEMHRKEAGSLHALKNLILSFFQSEDNRERIECCRYGQHPLCWAACTDQKDLVNLLIASKADIECKTDFSCVSKEVDEECGGDTILHMLVRQSSCLMSVRQGSGDHDPDEHAKGIKAMYESITDMYDHMLFQHYLASKVPPQEGLTVDSVRGKAIPVDDKWKPKNNRGWTPLQLAAAIGSADVFEHLVDSYAETIQWVFGSYTGSSLEIDLSHLDCFLPRLRDPSAKDSVISLIVRYHRKDLVSTKFVKNLLDQKWKKYAQDEFQKRILSTVLLLVCFVDVVMVPTSSNHKLLSGYGIQMEFRNGSLTVLLMAASLFLSIVLKLGGMRFPRLSFFSLRNSVGRQIIWSVVAVSMHVIQGIVLWQNLWTSMEYALYSTFFWTVFLPSRIQPALPHVKYLFFKSLHYDVPLRRREGLLDYLLSPTAVVMAAVALCPVVPGWAGLIVPFDYAAAEKCATGVHWVAARHKVAAAVMMLYVAFTTLCVEASKWRFSWDITAVPVSLFLCLVMYFVLPSLWVSQALALALVVLVLAEDSLKEERLHWERISAIFLFPFSVVVLSYPSEWFLSSMLLCALVFVRLAMFVGVYERFGDMVVFISNTRRQVVTVMFLYGLCVVAFAIDFTLLEVHSRFTNSTTGSPASDVAEWSRVRGKAMQQLGSFLWQSIDAFGGGDTSAADFSHRSPVLTAFLSMPLKILAHVIVPLVMVNLLIALMGKELDMARKESEQLWQLGRARMVELIDEELPVDYFKGEDGHAKKYWHDEAKAEEAADSKGAGGGHSKGGVPKVIYCFLDGSTDGEGRRRGRQVPLRMWLAHGVWITVE